MEGARECSKKLKSDIGTDVMFYHSEKFAKAKEKVVEMLYKLVEVSKLLKTIDKCQIVIKNLMVFPIVPDKLPTLKIKLNDLNKGLMNHPT